MKGRSPAVYHSDYSFCPSLSVLLPPVVCMHVTCMYFPVPPCFYMCLCSSVKPAVCVYSTWFTCSRRAGCQQQPRHFTFTLLDPNRCQEVRTSTIRCTDTGRTAGSSSVEGGACRFGCMWCMCNNLFHQFQALSDQLCVLTLPAFIFWSTCSRRGGYRRRGSHSTSGL